MTKKKENNTQKLKTILSAEVGGKARDWRRTERRDYFGDISREFENKNTGEKVTVSERSDGLVYAETAEGREITARLPFNKAAKPSAADVVINKILEDKDVDVNGALYKQAVAEGLVKRFSFYISRYDEGIGEEGEQNTFAVIYPTVRDETFKCAEHIAPLVPRGDDTDECVVTEWRFKGMDKAADIVKHLEGLGMHWDKQWQRRQKELYAEIKEDLGTAKPAAAAKAHKR